MTANGENVKKKQVPFAIKDCALAAIAVGHRAQNLRELRDHLIRVHSSCIYYHFWGGLLRPGFDDPEYNNDFASWAYHGLHDTRLAEQLGVIDPTEFNDLEALRQELVDVVEERLDESEMVPWARADQQFHFIRSNIVVFDTHNRIETPPELTAAVRDMSVGSIFYHFIDARRRTKDSVDDFEAWLTGFGNEYEKLADRIANIDPYFITLAELRQQLVTLLRHYFDSKAKGAKK